MGREAEIGEIKAILAKARLVTLTGAGGVGKTRLAIQIAGDLAAEYPYGAWFVDLAALTDPSLVAQSVRTTLRLHEDSGASPQDALIAYLQSRSLLLVLDNCEHLIAECARLADTLLKACPALKILATSREPLNIRGERPWRVPSLVVPDASLLTRPEKEIAAVLVEYDAVRLFVERVAQQHPAFVLTRDNAPAVAQICRQLDGIPLALELAAARARALAVEQIASQLEDRFQLLTGGARTSLPRHRTLQALIDWSYDLLTDQERRLLRRLAVFAGGWTLEAAEAVCSDFGLPIVDCGLTTADDQTQNPKSKIQNEDVLDLLLSLVDKSLVVYEEQEGAGRYRLLETTREYARERLMAEEEIGIWRDRHADYFLALAEEASVALQGPEQVEWLDHLQAAYDNLRAALDWLTQASCEEPGERGLRLAGALVAFWAVRGHAVEGRRWLEKALARGTERTAARAAALVGLGRMGPFWAAPDRMRSFFEAGLAIYEEIGDLRGVAHTLRFLSTSLEIQGDREGARDLLERSLALYRQSGDDRGVASVLNLMGKIAFNQGEYVAARDLLERSLAIAQATDDRSSSLGPLNNLGLVAYAQADYAAARRFHEACLAISREMESKVGMAWSLCNLGETTLTAGDPVGAQAFHAQSLALFAQFDHYQGVAECLRGLGLVAGAQREGVAQARRAACLFGAEESLRETLGTAILPYNRAEYERSVAAVRAALGEEAFAAAWAEGRALTPEQAIAYADTGV